MDKWGPWKEQRDVVFRAYLGCCTTDMGWNLSLTWSIPSSTCCPLSLPLSIISIRVWKFPCKSQIWVNTEMKPGINTEISNHQHLLKHVKNPSRRRSCRLDKNLNDHLCAAIIQHVFKAGVVFHSFAAIDGIRNVRNVKRFKFYKTGMVSLIVMEMRNEHVWCHN